MLSVAFVTTQPTLPQLSSPTGGQFRAHTCVRRTTALRSRHHASRPALFVRMSANTSSERRSKVLEGPFDGQFGSWYLTQGDADDVLIYRLCLLVCSACVSLATALTLVAPSATPPQAYDLLALLSCLSFGGALQTIHIYARPLHNLLKALWLFGFLGGIALSLSPFTHDAGVVASAVAKPQLLLAIGWQFVALTGLFVKEAFCFGRLEALLLIAIVPVLSGGHFLGVLPPTVEQSGAALFSVLFTFFALRKFSQKATDDIGDMSVFQYLESGKMKS